MSCNSRATVIGMCLVACLIQPARGAQPVASRMAVDLTKGLTLQRILVDHDEVVALVTMDNKPVSISRGYVIERGGLKITVRDINLRDRTVTLVDNKGHRAVLAMPSASPSPGNLASAPPRIIPGRRLKDGLALHGVITGEDGGEAYITVDGRMKSFHIGDSIQREGYIVTIKDIDPKKITVKIEDNAGNTTTLYPLPPAPPFIRRGR